MSIFKFVFKFFLFSAGVALATQIAFKPGSFALIVAFSASVTLVAMFLFDSKKKHEESDAHENEKDTEDEVKHNIVEMIYVRGGKFEMGATSEQGADALDNERPVRFVSLSDFHMMKFQVTQKLWQDIMGTNPSHFKGDNLPVENINWFEVQEFIHELNSITGKKYRLPTEAEWEYAARGGVKTKNYKYSGSYSIGKVALYGENADRHTHPVGTKQPNELNLYDMSGNVWEWVSDWYGEYGHSPEVNPEGPAFGSYRVRRGGGWYDNVRYCRVSRRYSSPPGERSNGTGFRLVLPIT